MHLFSNQQIALMQRVSGDGCEAVIRSLAFRCFPVAPSRAIKCKLNRSTLFSPLNQIDCPPQRFFHFNYHKFVMLRPRPLTQPQARTCASRPSSCWHRSEGDISPTNGMPRISDGPGGAGKVRV